MPKHMRHNLFLSLTLSASVGAAALITGCSSEPLLPSKSEEYSREFIKNFGVFDQSHDWNHATQTTVSVTTSRPTDIKVYAKVDDVRYLFGTYLNVNGQRTLNVDIPKGISDLIVNANGYDYNVRAGGAVNLDSRSRTITGSDSEYTTSDNLSWKIAPQAIYSTMAVNSYLKTYDENEKTNLSKGTNSFYFIADGKEHTFYPFYWWTQAHHVLGIYVVDQDAPSNITMHDLYYSKSGELTYSKDYDPNGEPGNGTWDRVGTEPAYKPGEGIYIKTRGVTYKLPQGTRYGFYIKVKELGKIEQFTNKNTYDYDFIIFSNSERNARPYYDFTGNLRNERIYKKDWSTTSWWAESGADESDKYAYSSWGVGEMDGVSYTMFGFEDWPADNNNTAADLNDIMFLFAAGEQPSKEIDTDELTRKFDWIIACEDLGTDDFDFNDVVFGVGNPVTDDATGVKTVDITALAAGGTLPVYIQYQDTTINAGGRNGGEFHSWFGEKSTSSIINAHTYKDKGETHTIKVNPDFTLACSLNVSGEGDSGNMGGFKVRVCHNSGDEVISASNPNIAASIGEAPQMICLPYTWLWPQENQKISTVYTLFEAWCEDYKHTDWHKDPIGKYVYRDVTGAGSSSGSGTSASGIGAGGSHAKPTPGGDEYTGKTELTGVQVGTVEWGDKGLRYRYTIDKDVLDKCISLELSLYATDVQYYDVLESKGDKYEYYFNHVAAGYKRWIVSEEDLSKIREDGGFDMIYYNVKDSWKYSIRMDATISE